MLQWLYVVGFQDGWSLQGKVGRPGSSSRARFVPRSSEDSGLPAVGEVEALAESGAAASSDVSLIEMIPDSFSD